MANKTPLHPSNVQLGKRGESRAELFLVSQGYTTLSRNFRFSHLEIDLICKDSSSNQLVFIEVKTRRSTEHGHPTDSVNHTKLNRLIIAAEAYVRRHNFDLDYRFDIISISPTGLEHFKNITWL